MAKEVTSKNERFAANGVSWQHYGHDLAYMMKRLDKMAEVIREQEKLLSQLVLQFCDLRDSRSEKPIGKRVTEIQDNCRIIQFSASRSR